MKRSILIGSLRARELRWTVQELISMTGVFESVSKRNPCGVKKEPFFVFSPKVVMERLRRWHEGNFLALLARMFVNVNVLCCQLIRTLLN